MARILEFFLNTLRKHGLIYTDRDALTPLLCQPSRILLGVLDAWIAAFSMPISHPEILVNQLLRKAVTGMSCQHWSTLRAMDSSRSSKLEEFHQLVDIISEHVSKRTSFTQCADGMPYILQSVAVCVCSWFETLISLVCDGCSPSPRRFAFLTWTAEVAEPPTLPDTTPPDVPELADGQLLLTLQNYITSFPATALLLSKNALLLLRKITGPCLSAVLMHCDHEREKGQSASLRGIGCKVARPDDLQACPPRQVGDNHYSAPHTRYNPPQ
nr:hypothetical protein CFP56_20937 [Quercus suber]